MIRIIVHKIGAHYITADQDGPLHKNLLKYLKMMVHNTLLNHLKLCLHRINDQDSYTCSFAINILGTNSISCCRHCSNRR